MRPGIGELFASAASISVVVVTLVATDARVTDRIAALARGPTAAGLSTTERLADVARLVWTAAREQAVEHAPLVVLAGVAATLLVLLART